MSGRSLLRHGAFRDPCAWRTAAWIASCFFALAVEAQPGNNTPCGTGVALTVGAANVSGTVSGATASTGVPAPQCGGTPGGDVWYSVVVPASGSISIITTSGSMNDAAMAVYAATSCSGPFTWVACNDDQSGGNDMPRVDLTCRTPGETLWIRIWKHSGSGSTFSIRVTDLNTPGTVNDDPCTATSLTVGASCSPVTGTTLCATSSSGIPAPGCANYQGGDVWFKFTAPASGSITVRTNTVSGSPLTDGGLALYSATTCSSGFALIACDDDNGPGNMSEITASCLTPGTTYYARMWDPGNNAAGSFTICAFDAGNLSATNDDPCTATTLTIGTSCSTVTGTNQCATTSSVLPPSCSNFQGGDVWFKFTAPASGGVTVRTSTVSGSAFTDSGLSLYTALSCGTPSSFTELACGDDISFFNRMSEVDISCLTPGSTIYVRVWAYGNSEVGAFNICAFDIWSGTPPANDEPCGAVPLTVNTTCVSTAGNNTGARASCGPPMPSCNWNSATSRDVWYSFVAPASGIAIIESTAGSLTDGAMALYTASNCNGPFIMISCDDNSGTGSMPFLAQTQLTPGATYYIRYWGVGGAAGTFNICVRAPAMPTGDCVYSLEMYDASENGWGASTVGVSINGGAYTAYTVTGGYNIVLIGLNIGNTIAVRYNVNGAGNQTDNRYALRMIPGGYPLFQSGPTPTPVAPTVAYQGTVNCVPPPASQQECAGSSVVCGSAGISNGVVGVGNSQDLNASNQGCLAQDERQGTWYVFSPATSGTLGFTITPAGNTDYDFAVWGPFTTAQCPPSNAPLRCSYAAPTPYVTGCGNGATDVSEGAGGNGWVAPINAVAGGIYILYVDNYEINGQQFNLTWSLSGGSSLDCSVTLPVELLSLNAEVNGPAIDVTWATASETNSDRFEVQRSADNAAFTPIGTVAAAGSSQQRIDYLFVDKQPMNGANYYRLEQFDIDGASTITFTVVAVFGRDGSVPLLFPNPAHDVLHIAFDTPVDGYTLLYIRDALGRVVNGPEVLLERGQRTVDLPTEQLAPGFYSLRIALASGQILNGGGFMKQ